MSDLMFLMDEDLDQYTKTGLKYAKPKPQKKHPKFLKKGDGEKRRKNISKKNRKKRDIDGFTNDVESMLKKASRKKYNNELSKKQGVAIEAIKAHNANLKLKPKPVNKFFKEYPNSPYHNVSSSSSSSDDEVMLALQKHLNQQRIRDKEHKARFNKMKGGKKRRRKKTRKRKKKKKKKKKKKTRRRRK